MTAAKRVSWNCLRKHFVLIVHDRTEVYLQIPDETTGDPGGDENDTMKGDVRFGTIEKSGTANLFVVHLGVSNMYQPTNSERPTMKKEWLAFFNQQ